MTVHRISRRDDVPCAHLRVLGSVDLTDAEGNEVRAVLAQPKRLALLVYLAIETPRGIHRRDSLLTLFWPERTEDAARAALSRAVYHLRKALGDEVIVSRTANELEVDFQLLDCDALEFEDRRTQGDRPGALAAYADNLLPGFFVDDAPEFMQWLDTMRERFRTAAARIATESGEHALAAGDHEAARSLSERALQLSAYDEGALVVLLHALVRQGDRTGALRAYEAFASRLATDLETVPSVATTELVEKIRADGMPPAPPARSSAIEASNTPTRSAITSAALIAGDGAVIAPRRERRARWALAGAGALLVTVAGALALRPPAHSDDHAILGDKVQLTRSNRAGMTTISPDGKQIAYLERRCSTTACEFVLLVQDVGGVDARVLTDSIAVPRYLHWSPDRRTLAFYGRHGTRTGTWLQDALGGPPRRVGDGPSAFFADGDSVLIAPTFRADSTHVFRVVSRDGAVHDSIVLRVPGGGVSALLAIARTPYFIALVNRAPGGRWQVFDRKGQLVDHADNACICGGQASDDALWLSRPGGPDGNVLVRLDFDRSNGHINPRQDTILKGLVGSFVPTADGSRVVVSIGQPETSVWLPTVKELFDGALPDERRIDHASQSNEWALSPDGTRLLVIRPVAVGTRPATRASIRPIDGGPEQPLAIPGILRAAHWADSVTVEFRVRGNGDTLTFGLIDVRDGTVRDRFVPGDSVAWSSTRIADGWAWVVPGGKSVRVVQRGVRHEWRVPGWFEQVYTVRGGTGVRVPLVLGGRVSGDSMAVAALDASAGRFDIWFRAKAEGESGIEMLGEGRAVVRTTRTWPFFDYTLLTGPGKATLVGSVKHPNIRASFSNDLSRVVAVENRLYGDAWMYEVLRPRSGR